MVCETAGRGQIRVAWTKGHAKEEHIAAGLSTPEEKRRNDEVDLLADKGREEHIRSRVELRAALHRTQVCLLAQTSMLKVWEARLELIADEESNIAAENEEAETLAELEREFDEAVSHDTAHVCHEAEVEAPHHRSWQEVQRKVPSHA